MGLGDGVMKKKGKLMKMLIISFMLIVTIFVTSSLLIINRMKSYGEKFIISEDNLPKDCDAIIVLGAGIKDDGTPSDILVDRLETSKEVYSAGVSETFILSGDHGREEYNEVKAMKEYIMTDDINEERIFLDHAGFSTYDTIYRAKEIFKVKKVIIVTNEYHLPRALYLARKMGIDAYGIASDKRNYLYIDNYKKREKLAQLKDFVYVNILKPKPEFLGESIPVDNSDGRLTDDEL